MRRPEGVQTEDAATAQEAYLVALQPILIEARCWKEKEPKQIKDNDGKKVKAARIAKIKHFYNEAEEAMSEWHETYTVGSRSRCRHCQSSCLLKNCGEALDKDAVL